LNLFKVLIFIKNHNMAVIRDTDIYYDYIELLFFQIIINVCVVSVVRVLVS
jgi:hypothetical protein